MNVLSVLFPALLLGLLLSALFYRLRGRGLLDGSVRRGRSVPGGAVRTALARGFRFLLSLKEILIVFLVPYLIDCIPALFVRYSTRKPGPDYLKNAVLA